MSLADFGTLRALGPGVVNCWPQEMALLNWLLLLCCKALWTHSGPQIMANTPASDAYDHKHNSRLIHELGADSLAATTQACYIWLLKRPVVCRHTLPCSTDSFPRNVNDSVS